MLDRALAIYRLRLAGHPSAEVRRRLRVSKSTVSVLGYLGAALAGMEPESVAQLRAPELTARDAWRLATVARTAERAACRDAITDEQRDQARRRAVVSLRAALRDHFLHARRAPGGTPGGRRVGSRRASDRSAAARAVGWSHAAWADDPVVFVERHLAALAAAHGYVAERAARAAALAGAEQALAGQAAAGSGGVRGIGGLRWRALAAAARQARTPAEDRALTALAVLTRKIREARDEAERLIRARDGTSGLDGQHAPARGGSDTHAPPPVTLGTAPDRISWDEVDADLAE